MANIFRFNEKTQGKGESCRKEADGRESELSRTVLELGADLRPFPLHFLP